jgi:hypothetical protein
MHAKAVDTVCDLANATMARGQLFEANKASPLAGVRVQRSGRPAETETKGEEEGTGI